MENAWKMVENHGFGPFFHGFSGEFGLLKRGASEGLREQAPRRFNLPAAHERALAMDVKWRNGQLRMAH